MTEFITQYSPPSSSNTNIERLVKQRSQFRALKQYKQADAIRNQLAFKYKIFFIDSDNDKWIQINTKWTNNESKKCLLWSHRKRSYCNKDIANKNGNDDINNNISTNFYCQHCIEKFNIIGRIPCPLDTRHNCLLTKMPSHLRFCQSKPGNNHINTHHEHKKQEVQIAKTLKKNINNLIVPENISPNEITKAMSNVNILYLLSKRIALILDEILLLQRKKNIDVYNNQKNDDEIKNYNNKAINNYDENNATTPTNKIEMEACMYIHKLYQNLPEIPYEYLVDKNLEIQIQQNTIAKVKRKHKFQQASIAKHTMLINNHKVNNIKNKSATLIEFCSGKGGLSKMVLDINDNNTKNNNNNDDDKNKCNNKTKIVKMIDFSSVILIDRTNTRNDVLNSPSMMNATKNIETIRINNDIANVDLQKSLKTQNSCAVGKHLCGAATDLSLKCYSNAMMCNNNNNNNNEEIDNHNDIKKSGSVTFAMCCHHLCTFDTFINSNLLQKHGIERGEFLLLRRLATKSRCHPKKVETLSAHKAKAKAEVGVLAKRLFNECRVAWLKNCNGWKNVRLIQYVSKDITPENVLLVGKYQ